MLPRPGESSNESGPGRKMAAARPRLEQAVVAPCAIPGYFHIARPPVAKPLAGVGHRDRPAWPATGT